jgi:hypothetical protein
MPKPRPQAGLVRTVVNALTDKDVRLAKINAKKEKTKFRMAAEALPRVTAQAAASAADQTRIREKYATQRKEAEELTERMTATRQAEDAARYAQLNSVILGSQDVDNADENAPTKGSENTTGTPTRWVQ